ncbi:MAG: sigma-E processing peptidase SpoIIGA [Oscillospiraceae bacterium]|nr:sigma-E processing peptidase SpoIIGA [Oscillospiraceae bacterium]
MTVIYVDILLVINLAVDYLVLFGTARLAGAQFARMRGLFGAAIGAVYSLIILFDVPGAFFALTKLMASMLMVLAVFGRRKPKDFFRLLMIFYICGFIFSGFMMLINTAVRADSFFVKGGIVYFEFSAMGIVLSGTAAFLVTEVLRRLFRHGEPEGCSMARIFYGEKSIVLKGFTDTGNSLSEPFSGTPVAVASADSLKEILPKRMFSAMEKGGLSTEYGFRLVPCKTVSGSVLMPVFRPSKVLIKNENGEFEAEDIMIGLSSNVPEKTLIIGKNLILKEKNKVFSEV